MQRHLRRLWLPAWLACQLCIAVSYGQTDAWQQHIDQAAEEGIAYEDAREHLDQALGIAEEFGPEDPRLSETLKALGDLEFSYDDYELAEPFYKRALDIRQEHLDPNDLDLARSHEDLAELYYLDGREQEAVEHFERTRDIFQEVLGEHHNDVAYMWTRIGWNQFHLERFEEAERSFQYAIALRLAAEADPENVANYRQELGEFYAWRDRPEDATEAFDQALEEWEGVWGEADPRFIEKLQEIAQEHWFQNQHDEQEALLQRVLLIQERAHGPKSLEVADASSKIGDFWVGRDDPEPAEHFYRRAVEIRTEVDGDPLLLADELLSLSDVLSDLERYEDAIEVAKRAHEIHTTELEAKDLRIAGSLDMLARLNRSTENYEQAAAIYNELVAFREAEDQLSQESAFALLSLGEVQMEAEEYSKAVEAFERAVAIFETHEDSPALAGALFQLSQAYRKAGRVRDAVAAQDRASEIQLEQAMDTWAGLWKGFAERTFGSERSWVVVAVVVICVVVILGFAAGMTAVGALVTKKILRQYEPPPGAPVEPEPPEPEVPAPIILPGAAAPAAAHAAERGAIGAVWAVPTPEGWTPPTPDPSPILDSAPSPAPVTETPALESQHLLLPTEAKEAAAPANEEPPEPVPTRRFAFHGNGGSLFGIHIVNMFLALVTLGIYYFWGKIKALKYVYSQAEFDGDRFAFHGTGKELFLGWLKAFPLILLLYFFPQLLGMLWQSELAQIVGVFVLVGGIMIIIPIAQIGAYRYRLSRTSWRGIRFSFRGRTKKYFSIYLKGMALTTLSLGLYSPVMMVELLRYQYDNTYFGNTKLRFHARAIEIFPAFILSWVLSFATLGLFGFWYQAELARYFWSHTTFSTARMRCTATGGGLLKLTVGNGLLALCTLGLAYPWVQVRTARYWLENVYLENDLDLTVVEQDAQQVSAAAEGMADFLDLPMGF